jgi:hypothetical protein
MTTQTVRFGAQGTPTTVKTFQIGTDTVVGTGINITKATNAAAMWTCQFIDHAPGIYQIIATDSEETCLAQWYVRIKSEEAVYQAYEIPDAQSWTEERAQILDQVLIAEDENRTVKVTNENYVASTLYTTQKDSISEEAFQTGAVSERVISTDLKELISTIVDTATNDKALQETLLLIKEKTDNIPNDPADQSEIVNLINTLISSRDRIILGPCESNVHPLYRQ